MTIRTVGIWVNEGKPNAPAVADALRAALAARGIRVACGKTDPGACDLLAVLGGDGTLLCAMDAALPRSLPIWGINLGNVGFLCETEPNRIIEDVDLLIAGAYRVEERMLLEARGDGGLCRWALNELVVARAADCMRIIRFDIFCHGELVERFAGDGVIVSTPTGSTAYSFSAGGPVVAPGAELMVLTPICAHTPGIRPIVLPPSAQIEIYARGPGQAQAAVDGRAAIPLAANARLTVRRAPSALRFIRLHERNFFDLLRGKMTTWASSGEPGAGEAHEECCEGGTS